MERSHFEQQFIALQPQLRSYLYRITCNRELADDLAQDTYLKAVRALNSFQEKSSLKTWVFQIATNLARDQFAVQRRFTDSAQDKAKLKALTDAPTSHRITAAFQSQPDQHFDVREHIAFCFTCISKTLEIEQQIAVILADMYDFKRTEIGIVLGRTEGVVKHLLFNGRKRLQDKFHQRCALVNKQGACYQCAELSDYYNSAAETRRQLATLPLNQQETDDPTLLKIRAALVRQVDPLHAKHAPINEVIMEIIVEEDAVEQPIPIVWPAPVVSAPNP